MDDSAPDTTLLARASTVIYPSGLTRYQIHVLRYTSLVLSFITLTSTILVLYWFNRMRRSFRHEYACLLFVQQWCASQRPQRELTWPPQSDHASDCW